MYVDLRMSRFKGVCVLYVQFKENFYVSQYSTYIVIRKGKIGLIFSAETYPSHVFNRIMYVTDTQPPKSDPLGIL